MLYLTFLQDHCGSCVQARDVAVTTVVVMEVVRSGRSPLKEEPTGFHDGHGSGCEGEGGQG